MCGNIIASSQLLSWDFKSRTGSVVELRAYCLLSVTVRIMLLQLNSLELHRILTWGCNHRDRNGNRLARSDFLHIYITQTRRIPHHVHDS